MDFFLVRIINGVDPVSSSICVSCLCQGLRKNVDNYTQANYIYIFFFNLVILL